MGALRGQVPLWTPTVYLERPKAALDEACVPKGWHLEPSPSSEALLGSP